MPPGAPRSIALQLLDLAWRPLLFAIPFGLFFGTIYNATVPGYLGAYVVSVVFAYAIMACMFVTRHALIPMLIREDSRVGSRGFWKQTIAYTAASFGGSMIAAVIIHHTLAPGFLGSGRQIAVVITYAAVFTVLVGGIVLVMQLYRRAVASVRSEQELNLARRIQNSFLISQFPEMPRLEVHASNIASRHVSGDFYDVIPAGDRAYLLAIADVAGKGVPAALMSSMLQASLRTQALVTESVAEILTVVNRLVYRSTAVHQFATFFLARVDESTLRLTYANAGHNHPILFRAGGERVELARGGPLVGILEHAVYEQGEITLAAGDRLLIYTDGISEAMAPGQEPFGEDRLIEAVAALPPGLSARATGDGILDAVRAYVGDADPSDDMTVMVLHVRS